MNKTKEFRLLGLTQEQHDFLYQYAQNQLGSKSRTKALLNLIDGAMQGDIGDESAQNLGLHEEENVDKSKKRIQVSLLAQDYDNLEKIAKHTDSSMQHYLRCMVRSHLYGKNELLGNEMEVLRRSNYELHRLGVNINQIAKAINTGHEVELNERKLRQIHKEISDHVALVEKILKDNLYRY